MNEDAPAMTGSHINRPRSLICLAIAVCAFSCVLAPGFTQTDSPAASDTPGDTLELDLIRSIEIALGSSPDAFSSRNNLSQSYVSFRSAALELYSPQVDLDLMTPSFQQALSEQYVFDPDQARTVRKWVETDNQRWQGGLSINQPVPTGGQFRLESAVYRRFYTSDLTGEKNALEYSSSYRASFTQELLRGNLKRYARRQAQIAYEQAQINALQTQRNLVFNVLQAYFGLLASWRELEISRDDLNSNRETANLARRKLEAGLIPEVEALQLEVEAASIETELLTARADYEGQLDRFRDLIGLPLEQPVRIVGEPGFDTISVNLDSAVAVAKQRREELRLSELTLDQARLSLKNTRRPWFPGAQITGFYDLDLLTNTQDDLFSTRYNDYAVNRGFAVNLNIPLFGGGRRDLDVQAARLALRRAEFDAGQAEKQVIMDVRAAVRSLNESRRRYEISLASLKIAEKSYDISRQRFANGQITAQDWINAQIQVNRSRISASRALMDHNVALARYRLAIGDSVLPGVGINPVQPDTDF